VTAFAWEPKGDRFALITTSDPNFGQTVPGSTIKTTLGFYALDVRKGDFKILSAYFIVFDDLRPFCESELIIRVNCRVG
jgi:hypothetical protein